MNLKITELRVAQVAYNLHQLNLYDYTILFYVFIHETNRHGWNMLVFLHLNYILKLKENTPNIGYKKFCLSEEEHESHKSK